MLSMKKPNVIPISSGNNNAVNREAEKEKQSMQVIKLRTQIVSKKNAIWISGIKSKILDTTSLSNACGLPMLRWVYLANSSDEYGTSEEHHSTAPFRISIKSGVLTKDKQYYLEPEKPLLVEIEIKLPKKEEHSFRGQAVLRGLTVKSDTKNSQPIPSIALYSEWVEF